MHKILRTVLCSIKPLHVAYKHHSKQMQRVCRSTLLLSGILTTLIATVLCIVHCHTFTRSVSSPPVVTFTSEHVFVCHTPGPDTPTMPVPLDAHTLRGLHEAMPFAISLVLPTMVFVAWRCTRDGRVTSLVNFAPEPPPPRLRAILLT